MFLGPIIGNSNFGDKGLSLLRVWCFLIISIGYMCKTKLGAIVLLTIESNSVILLQTTFILPRRQSTFNGIILLGHPTL